MEFLDELVSTKWFSKLDLKAGYHQIWLLPREEPKTAFQTHVGHFEFRVMAFGLTGAPNTFFDAMNSTLSLVLRKCALLVFFNDILIYSTTLDQHIIHLESVLQLLRRDQWKVNLSKCAFAQTTIAYLGHIINGQGVATDPTKIQVVQCSNGQHQRMPKSSEVSSVWSDSIESSLGILASYPDLSHTC